MSKNFVWAFDPHMQDKLVSKHLSEILNLLAVKTRATIKPVYVVTPIEMNLPEFVRREVLAALRKVKVRGIQKPHLIFDRSGLTITGAVKCLNAFATKAKTKAIVVGTHSRSGIKRFFLGSFAESLLMYSKSAVILVGPKTKKQVGIKRILFATDLSKESKKSFKELLSFAKEIGAELQIFHALQTMSYFANFFDNPAGAQEAYYLAEALKDQEKASIKELKKLEIFSRASGVKARSQIERGVDSVGDSILRAGKDFKADFIAVGTQRGPVRASLGSVARFIVRKSVLPVWVAPR